MTKIGGFLRRKNLTKLTLYLKRILAAVGDAQPSRNTDAVGIADVSRLVKNITENEIRGFSPDAGQGNKFFHGSRNFSVKI